MAGVAVTETTYLRLAPEGTLAPGTNSPLVPVATGEPSAAPVDVGAGAAVMVRIAFTYDCTRLGTVQLTTVRARGATPVWSTVEVRRGGIPSGLPGLLDFACTPLP